MVVISTQWLALQALVFVILELNVAVHPPGSPPAHRVKSDQHEHRDARDKIWKTWDTEISCYRMCPDKAWRLCYLQAGLEMLSILFIHAFLSA